MPAMQTCRLWWSSSWMSRTEPESPPQSCRSNLIGCRTCSSMTARGTHDDSVRHATRPDDSQIFGHFCRLVTVQEQNAVSNLQHGRTHIYTFFKTVQKWPTSKDSQITMKNQIISNESHIGAVTCHPLKTVNGFIQPLPPSNTAFNAFVVPPRSHTPDCVGRP